MEGAPQQPLNNVFHVIEDETTGVDPSQLSQQVHWRGAARTRQESNLSVASAAAVEDFESSELQAFAEAMQCITSVGGAVIGREAAMINGQLLRIQHKRTAPSPPVEEQALSNKKSKIAMLPKETTPSMDKGRNSSEKGDGGDDSTVGDDCSGEMESCPKARIWNRVDRMQRMSLYLRNAQIAQDLFYLEMNECLQEQELQEHTLLDPSSHPSL